MPNRTQDTYVYTDRFGGTATAEVDAEYGPYWRHWTQFAGFGPVWVWTHDSHERIYIYAHGTIQLFVDFRASQGSRWKVDVGACNRNVEAVLASRDERVVVPAGTFEHCMRVDLGSSCMDAGVMSIWFAQDVGVVKWVSQSIAGPNASEFSRGTVGGVTYPKAPKTALTLKGSTDRFEYWINKMPGVGPSRQATRAHATLSITNNTGRPIKFTFGTPLEFEIFVRDPAGKVVSFMTRGQMFACVTHERTLGDGETWNFKGDVELRDDMKKDLPEGTYTVEAVIKAVPRFITTHTIRIQYAY
jgi:hypothetical protein